MKERQIPRHYAKLFFHFCLRKKCEAKVRADIKLLLEACRTNGFVDFLANPAQRPVKKTMLLEKVLRQRINPITWHFLLLLSRHGRLQALPDILTLLMDHYRDHEQTGLVHIRIADSPSSETEKQLRQSIRSFTGWQQVNIAFTIEPKLLGGYIIRLGNLQLDMSLSHRLEMLQKRLKKPTRQAFTDTHSLN